MKQIARCEFGGGLSEISLNKLIIKLIKRNIRIPSGSLKEESYKIVALFFYLFHSLFTHSCKLPPNLINHESYKIRFIINKVVYKTIKHLPIIYKNTTFVP